MTAVADLLGSLRAIGDRHRLLRGPDSPWCWIVRIETGATIADPPSFPGITWRRNPSTAGGTPLVIVESPAKARTISKFLGRGYTIEASIGHIRDLPQGAKEIPEQYKKEDWAYLGVDVNHGFEPVYVIPHAKGQQVRKLKSTAERRQRTLSGHGRRPRGGGHQLAPLRGLAPKVPVHRLVFHEITKEAILAALRQPSANRRQPRASPGGSPDRRPPLWLRRIPTVVEKSSPTALGRPGAERCGQADRRARTPADGLPIGHLLGLVGNFRQVGQPALRGRADLGRWPADPHRPRLRSGHRRIEGSAAAVADERQAAELAERLRSAPCRVASLEDKPYTTRPYPPFTTSTLQQEANRKYGFTARHTMQVAQSLYENGHITYMRTDSTTLATRGGRGRPAAGRFAIRQ